MGLPPTSCPARATPGAFRRAAQGLAATALCLGGLAGTADAALPPAQRAALVDLYNASNGPGWTNSSNWLVGDPCNDGWFGIGCGGGGTTVTSVELPNNQLRGNLGPLADLPGLTTFNVHTNQLTGPIPALAGLASLSSSWSTETSSAAPCRTWPGSRTSACSMPAGTSSRAASRR
ncbi:MAG TPA: hypothetical protein VMS38_16265 [Pseudorhodoferax sp.]|nr:hypothetical protein [Pseudorhodoferax sp.]